MSDDEPKNPDDASLFVVGPFRGGSLLSGIAEAIRQRAASGLTDPLTEKLKDLPDKIEAFTRHRDAREISKRVFRYLQHVEEAEVQDVILAAVSLLANVHVRYTTPRDGVTDAEAQEGLLKLVGLEIAEARERALRSPSFIARCRDDKANGEPYPHWMDPVLAAKPEPQETPDV